ncbi:hypothetical protein [Aquidulcibacter sp.]|uniref:hypothetical protein n=1 Tax=Aquidulcibacter sp. TaxID=2052990 RepID=UPI0025C14227|nr:hypothetical protein [Aquidulcibacter sp.]MCA3695002.1 hypothetical protein [Aquidulcibacter sp.]
MTNSLTIAEAAELLARVPIDVHGQTRFVRVVYEGSKSKLKGFTDVLSRNCPEWSCSLQGNVLYVYVPVALDAESLAAAHDAITLLKPSRSILEIGFEIALEGVIEEAVKQHDLIENSWKPGTTFAFQCADGLWAHLLFVAGGRGYGAWVNVATERTQSSTDLDWDRIGPDKLAFNAPRHAVISSAAVTHIGKTRLNSFVADRTFVYRHQYGWDETAVPNTAVQLGLPEPQTHEEWIEFIKAMVVRDAAFSVNSWMTRRVAVSLKGTITILSDSLERDCAPLIDAPLCGFALDLADLEAAAAGRTDYYAALMERVYPLFPPN